MDPTKNLCKNMDWKKLEKLHFKQSKGRNSVFTLCGFLHRSQLLNHFSHLLQFYLDFFL